MIFHRRISPWGPVSKIEASSSTVITNDGTRETVAIVSRFGSSDGTYPAYAIASSSSFSDALDAALESIGDRFSDAGPDDIDESGLGDYVHWLDGRGPIVVDTDHDVAIVSLSDHRVKAW